METAPGTQTETDAAEWVAYEHEAAWCAKLAILRAQSLDHIAHFGACLREHERHGKELSRNLPSARHTPPGRATFLTQEPHIVGALSGADELLDAFHRIEASRVARYEARVRAPHRSPSSMLDAILERHLVDARARLDALRRIREPRRSVAA
jgi:hypothetical protein